MDYLDGFANSHQPIRPADMNYFCGRYKRITCFSRDVTNPTKDTREITDHHVLRMFRKCRMLNLTFLRDSYVTWERRRLQTTKFQAFGGLLGTFGEHFGSVLGTFSAHFSTNWRPGAHSEAYGFKNALIVCLEGALTTFWGRENGPKRDRCTSF